MSSPTPPVWSTEVENVAKSNVALSAEILECHEQILECGERMKYWQTRLYELQKKHDEKQVCVRLKTEGAKAWNALSVKKRWKKENLLAVLQSEHERPASLKEECWETYVPETLRNDRDILLARLERNPTEFVLPDCCRGDKEVICKLIEHFPAILYRNDVLTPDLLSDAKVLRTVLRSNANQYTLGDVLSDFSTEIRSNANLMLEGLQRRTSIGRCTGPILAHIGDSLKESKDFALQVAAEASSISIPDNALQYFSPQLRDDREVVLALVSRNGMCLQNASISLRQDAKIIRAAALDFPHSLVRWALGAAVTALTSDKSFVLQILKRADDIRNYKGSLWRACATELKQDRDVILAALTCTFLRANMVPAELESDRLFWMEAVRKLPRLWEELPQALIRDDDILLAALKGMATSSCSRDIKCSFAQMHQLSPRIVQRRDLWVFLCETCVDSATEFMPVVFFDDKDLMVRACRSNGYMLQRIPAPLNEDGDIIRVALESKPRSLSFVSAPVQRRNPDLVVLAIRHSSKYDSRGIFTAVDKALWAHRDVLLAWISKGGGPEVRDHIAGFAHDRELFLLLAEHNPDYFGKVVSQQLRSDKEFMLQVVAKNGRLLRKATKALQEDFDLALAAFVGTKNLAQCYDTREHEDLRLIANFAKEVRERIETREGFVKQILCGMSLGSRAECHLRLLDQGQETALAYRQLIAEYAGIPFGKELRLLRQASMNLVEWGF